MKLVGYGNYFLIFINYFRLAEWRWRWLWWKEMTSAVSSGCVYNCWAVQVVSTVLCATIMYCIILYCTALYCTVLHYTVLYCIVLYCVVPCILCGTVLYYVVLRTVCVSTYEYRAMAHGKILYNTIQCSTVL